MSIPQYWSEQERKTDEEAQKIRSVPVPASLVKHQKFNDDRVKVDLGSEFLANRGKFYAEFPNVANLPPEEMILKFQDWLSKVKEAPEEQREDANKHLGNHAAFMGKAIGKGILKGIGKVAGLPGISHTLSGLSRPGEEVAGASIYNFQKWILPGEQSFERNYRLYYESGKGAGSNWWSKGWYSNVSREHGYDVPWYVSLPLEMILDPLNFVPFAKVAKLSGQGMMKLGPEARRVHRVTQGLQKLSDTYANYGMNQQFDVENAANAFHDDIGKLVGDLTDDEAAQLAKEMGQDPTDVSDILNLQGRGRPGQTRYQTGAPDPFDLTDTTKTGWENLSDDDLIKKLLADGGLEIEPVIQEAMEAELRHHLDRLRQPGADATLVAEELLDGMPTHGVVGGVLREAPQDQDLYDIIYHRQMDSFWNSMTNGPVLRDALKFMYHTGVRPNEVERVRWNDIAAHVGDRARSLAAEDKLTNNYALSLVEGAVTSQRALDDDAYKFLDGYVGANEAGFQSTVLDFAGTLSDETLAFGRGGVPIAAGDLNAAFKEAAEAFDNLSMSLGRTPGADLVKFYAKDGNRGNDQFSYVFRLNKANVAYARDNDLTTVMQLLGHASATHTARYVSLAHQNLGNSTHVLNTIFSSVVGKGSNLTSRVNIPALISKAMGDLNATDGALATDFLKAVTEEGLDATQEALKFKGDINIFNPKMNRPASNKGFTVSNVMQVNEKIDAAREDLLNQIINSSNSKRMVDVTGYGGAEKWPTDMPDFQGWDIEKHIIALEDINKFASFLETAKLTRQLIANSKEVVGSKVNYTPAQKARIKKMKDEALIAQRVLDEWLETSISLSKRHLKANSKDK